MVLFNLDNISNHAGKMKVPGTGEKLLVRLLWQTGALVVGKFQMYPGYENPKVKSCLNSIML
jgi:hypothetical protein